VWVVIPFSLSKDPKVEEMNFFCSFEKSDIWSVSKLLTKLYSTKWLLNQQVVFVSTFCRCFHLDNKKTMIKLFSTRCRLLKSRQCLFSSSMCWPKTLKDNFEFKISF
jgi:hypothetical protein